MSYMSAASFSASVEYKSLSEVTRSKRSVIMETLARCSTYKAAIVPGIKVIRSFTATFCFGAMERRTTLRGTPERRALNIEKCIWFGDGAQN